MNDFFRMQTQQSERVLPVPFTAVQLDFTLFVLNRQKRHLTRKFLILSEPFHLSGAPQTAHHHSCGLELPVLETLQIGDGDA